MYLAGADPLHAWALAGVRRIAIGDEHLTVAPPEYVIVRKLEYHREGASEKHLRDITSIVRLSGDDLDVPTLERLCAERGLVEAWRDVRNRAG